MAKTAPKATTSRIVVPLWQAVLLALICLGAGGVAGYVVKKAPPPPQQEAATTPNPMGMMAQDAQGQQGMSEQDRQKIEKEIEGSKDYARLVEIGDQMPDQGEAPLAILAYQKALTIKSTDPNVWTDLGAVYTDHLGENKKAIDAFNKAIALDPKHTKAHFNLAIATVRETGDGKQMMAILGEYTKIATSPDEIALAKDLINSPAPTLRKMAKDAREAQHLTEAENEMKAAMQLGPADPEDLYFVGTIYIHQGKYKEALAEWDKYEKAAPNGASMSKVKEMRPNIERLVKEGAHGMPMPPGGMGMPPSGMGGG